jgi:hypothetical protein
MPMHLQLSEDKSSNSKHYSESDKLMALKNEAGKILRELELGAIDSAEAARRLNLLARGENNLLMRMFRF